MSRFWARVLVVLIVAFVIEGGITHYGLWRQTQQIHHEIRQRSQDRTVEARAQCELENRTNDGFRTFVHHTIAPKPGYTASQLAQIRAILADADAHFTDRDCSKIK